MLLLLLRRALSGAAVVFGVLTLMFFLLRLAPGAILLVSESVDADPDGRPIQYALSRFPADRLELIV